jgi:putative acetyltransferase
LQKEEGRPVLKMPEFVREMRRGEEEAVDGLLRRAFGGADEAQLVLALRKSGAMAGEMVLPFEGGVVGYYALRALKGPKGWRCLAPVAIDPDWQGRGHGRRMVKQLVAWAEASNSSICVLGDVDFYKNCGFSTITDVELITPYSADHTLVAGTGPLKGAVTLEYPKAFGS